MIKKSLAAIFVLLVTFASYGVFGVNTAYAAGNVSLYTPYPGVTVSPGASMNYTVTLMNHTGNIQQSSFKVEGLSKNWTYKLTASGNSLNQLAVKPGSSQSITLTVNVPLKVNKGNYPFTLVANSGGSNGNHFTSKLPLDIKVAQQGTFKTVLSVGQPNMQGTANANFSYTATLKNDTDKKHRYALSANPPNGWSVVFKSGGKNVTSVVVNPGSSKNITVKMNPPKNVKAGDYKATVKASSNATSAKSTLDAVITGTYKMNLTTPSGRLSANITAGQKKTLNVKVENQGSAPLRNVHLSSTTPPNWKVEFSTPTIPMIAPGKSKTISATVSASNKAIAGDYVLKMNAASSYVSSNAQFRMSVKTSMLWGWIGILIILAVLAGIYALFRTYGRR